MRSSLWSLEWLARVEWTTGAGGGGGAAELESEAEAAVDAVDAAKAAD